MAAAFSDRFSDATRQLAAAATRANRLALENAESMFGVQLKAMERNLTATGGWLVNWPAATTRPGCSTGAHSCGRTTCSGWARPSRMVGLGLQASKAWSELVQGYNESTADANSH